MKFGGVQIDKPLVKLLYKRQSCGLVSFLRSGQPDLLVGIQVGSEFGALRVCLFRACERCLILMRCAVIPFPPLVF